MKFYDDDMYLNSLCLEGLWLHDFHIVRAYEDVVVELCTHCKMRRQFKNNGSNIEYMSYHVKQSLQPYQNRFYKEYSHIT
jgi:hypothetical protein